MEQKKVCVITGGGSGMGLEAAKIIGKEKVIVLAGRTVKKLENAIVMLKDLEIEAYAHPCDASDRKSVVALAQYANSLGKITTVIHAAGLSPAMADAEKLLRVNALGTVYVNLEFSNRMSEGGVIVDISSNSAYVLPKFLENRNTYALAETNEEKFLKKCIKLSKLPRDDYKRAGFAYAISKNFVIWFAKKCAIEYGKKGIRVVSLSPGLIATDMGNLEAEEGSSMLKYGAFNRMGKPEELGFAIASVADERNGYLAGVDILCDGGCTSGQQLFK